MPNLEWRHAIGDEPAWLMADGQMVGEWHPKDGGRIMIGYPEAKYFASTDNEAEARTILEGAALDRHVRGEHSGKTHA